jgi:LEA14-like dessication related protein
MKLSSRGALVLLAAALSACAALRTRTEPPNLALVDLRVRDATLLAQSYSLAIQLQNPNDFDLAIDGMACELLFNDNLFASGVSNQAVTIPRYGTNTLQVTATGTLFGIFRQLSELERNQSQTFRYQLRGHVSVRRAGRLPFDQSGELSLVPRDLQRPL